MEAVILTILGILIVSLLVMFLRHGGRDEDMEE